MTVDAPLAPLRAGISEARFTAMGNSAQAIVVGGAPSLVRLAERRIAELEAAWTRFVPTSELQRLNAMPERDVEVSEELFVAVERAVDAWHLTAGSFDPTMRDAIEAAGYDVSFSKISGRREAAPASAAIGCGDLELDGLRRTVRLPRGVAIDLGGIGKGLAADLVVAELFRHGAEGVLVNLGGDLRVAGTAPSPDGWIVAIEDPFHAGSTGVCVALADGAVATSSVRKKRWESAGRPMHHLLDPRTGRPLTNQIETVTVVANEGWLAEALTKAVFVLGIDRGFDLIERHGVQALAFLSDGSNVGAGRWKDILA